MFEAFKETLHKYKKWEPLVFFVGGFSFDALLLHRIDNPIMLVHQAIYLTLSALIIAWDLFCEEGKGSIPPFLNKVWKYREAILHFMLGTLLNVYTIFYFKSGSFVSSIIFLAILGTLLYLNEVRPVKISKHLLRNALFSLCLVSYMNIVVAIVLGSVGLAVFLAGVGAASLVYAIYTKLLRRRLEGPIIWPTIRAPFIGVVSVYLLLYFFKILPPVPLSAKYMGIYREVSKVGELYKLGYARPSWKFWEHGDQTFAARPGDKIYFFAQIFSPSRFKDQIFVRWEFKDPKHGWQSWDAIPLNVVGGREEGFRGYTIKTNYQEGKWRVSLETKDGRQIGRLGLEVVAPEGSGEDLNQLSYDLR